MLALLIACSLDVTTAYAQATDDVCSNTPATGERISCTQGAMSTIDIDTQSVTITTTEDDEHGISADHSGNGNIDVKSVSDTITTSGAQSYGINARLGEGDGDLSIHVTSPTIRTQGDGSYGISGYSLATGKLDVDVVGGSITTTGGRDFPSTAGSPGVGLWRSSAGGAVELDIRGNATITTTSGQSPGVFVIRRGDGDSTITLRDTMISTVGPKAHGVYGTHERAAGPPGQPEPDIIGNVDIRLLENVGINTQGEGAHGVFAYHNGKNTEVLRSNAIITVRNSTITTAGSGAAGLRSDRVDGGAGTVRINVRDTSITTESTASANTFGDTLADGIFAYHDGSGDIDIDTERAVIETKGVFSRGILAHHIGAGNINLDIRGGSVKTAGEFSYGIYGNLEKADHGGEISIETGSGHTVTTTGANGHGIVAYNYGTMDTSAISIDVGGSIDASGAGAQGVRVGVNNAGEPQRVAAIDTDGYRQQTVTVNGRVMGNAAGVQLAGGGRVVIGRRGSIGATSGIAILATGVVPADTVNMISAIQPKLRVDLNLGGRRVAQALGDNWIINDGGETTIAVNRVTLHDGATGNTGRTAPNGAWNVRMREEGVTVTDYSDPDPAAWSRTDPAAGVITDRDFSAGDFNETARPRPPSPPPPPMPQTVMVDEPVFGAADEVAGVYLPAGGRVLIGPAGTVGGESGIAILAGGDAPMLHVDLRLNGRRVMEVIGDDWIINDGGETTIVVNDVTLHDGPTGVVADAVAPNGAWNVRMKAEGVTVDRTDPDNWVITEPAAGVVADRDFSTDDFIETSTQPEPTKPPLFTEEYAPRAALYELLPDFLLRLTGPGPNRRCLSAPDSSIWTRVAGGQGAYESDRSTTGATYDLERFEAEGGLSASLGKRAKGWVSVRHVTGSAGVASPTGGGAIDVRGLGSSVGGSWQGANDVYAVGCFSYLAYDVDFASKQQGVLKAGVDGHSYTLDLEAGRRFAMGEQWHLTPRVWVVGSRVSVDDFTDAVDSRVSLSGADRILGGLGVLAETVRPWGDDGEFALRGSVDYERMFRGATTTTQVSGEQLSAVATDNSLLVGLNGVYRQGRFSIGAEVAARQELGSTDSEYTSFLNLGMRF